MAIRQELFDAAEAVWKEWNENKHGIVSQHTMVRFRQALDAPPPDGEPE